MMSEVKRVAFTTISSSTNNPTTVGNGSSSISSVTGLSASSIGVSNTSIKKSSGLGLLHDKVQPSAPTLSTDGLISSASSSMEMAAPVSRSNFSSDSMTSQEKNISSMVKSLKTVRFNLELFEPNSNTFPEFNFSKLINLEKKKQKKAKQKSAVNGFSDPFADNDDDVARIAKEMEKKYGTTYASGRGRNKKDDFCDIGLGYDESDSFIDNTEAYDEIIPEEVETVEGGFYINSGALEFKRLSNYEKTDEIIKIPIKLRKRALSTSSSEGSEFSHEENIIDKNQEIDTSNNGASITTEYLSKDSLSKSKNPEKRTKCDQVVLFKETKLKSKEKKLKVKANDEVIPTDLPLDKVKEREVPTIKTTTVKDMLKAKRDNFLKQQEDEIKVKGGSMVNGEVKGHSNAEDDSSDTSGEDDDSSTDEPNIKRHKNNDDENTEKLRSTDVKLPFDLPEILLDDLNEIKEAAKSTNRIGKNFHFDDKLTDKFLKIDEYCLCLGKPIRNLVFAHLEYQLSLSKYFLLRKAKQLRIKAEKSKTKKAFVKLKKAVFEIMPNIMLNYELNFKKVEELRSCISADDLKKMDHPPKFPKKRFQWNDTLRNLLYDLFQTRWTSFTVLRTRKETFEDFVGNYLKNKVVSIWPSGWMKYEELQKELDKRKNLAKKSKENKKPSASINSLTSQPSSSVSADRVSPKCKQSNELESINEDSEIHSKSTLSKSDSLSVVSSRDLVVTIASNRNIEKSNDSPDSSDQKQTVAISSCLNSGNPAKPEYSSQKFESETSNSENTEKLCNNNNGNTNVTNSNKFVIDLTPAKRTDHSISNLIFTPPTELVPSKLQHSSKSTTTGSKCLAADIASSNSQTTHVINIDNLKNSSEIIDTSNQLIQNTSHSAASMSKDDKLGSSNRSRENSTVSSRRDSNSSDSDGVEIVGVYPMSPTINLTSKNKYNLSSSSSSNGGSSSSRCATPIDTIINDEKINEESKQSTSTEQNDEKDTDNIDVNKIMKALKGLEKMQKSKFKKISPTHNRDNNNHTSLSFGKDIKQ